MEKWKCQMFDRYYKSWWGIDAAYDKIADMCGVTSNMMNILTLLYKNKKPMTQNELSQEFHLSRQTVTSVIDSLEKKGLVTRAINPSDRRNRLVSLTEEGLTSSCKIGRTMRNIELSAFQKLSEDEQNALVDTMEKLWHGMEDVLSKI